MRVAGDLSNADFADVGGLISYGLSLYDADRQRWHLRRTGSSRVPSPPICRWNSRPNSNWSINLKTAKALGLTIPPSILARADEVIE